MQFDEQSKFLEELKEIGSREKAFEKLKNEEFVKGLIQFINSEEIVFASISDVHYFGLINLLPLTTKVIKALIKLDSASNKGRDEITLCIKNCLISSIDSIFDLGVEEMISDDFIDKLEKYKQTTIDDLKYFKQELEDETTTIERRKQLRADIQNNVNISSKLSQIDELLKEVDLLIKEISYARQ